MEKMPVFCPKFILQTAYKGRWAKRVLLVLENSLLISCFQARRGSTDCLYTAASLDFSVKNSADLTLSKSVGETAANRKIIKNY
jgi:hypothetical protein